MRMHRTDGIIYNFRKLTARFSISVSIALISLLSSCFQKVMSVTRSSVKVVEKIIIKKCKSQVKLILVNVSFHVIIMTNNANVMTIILYS